MSKWIDFKETSLSTQKTKRFYIHTKDSDTIIGKIKWYAQWRKYSFFPEVDCVFETECLRDIISFIDKLMLERKIEKQNAQQ